MNGSRKEAVLGNHFTMHLLKNGQPKNWKKLMGTPPLKIFKFGSIGSHSPMKGHVGHPKASQGDLENQPIL
jgi:hypothetical protein